LVRGCHDQERDEPLLEEAVRKDDEAGYATTGDGDQALALRNRAVNEAMAAGVRLRIRIALHHGRHICRQCLANDRRLSLHGR
jgi:hypothetical protein